MVRKMIDMKCVNAIVSKEQVSLVAQVVPSIKKPNLIVEIINDSNLMIGKICKQKSLNQVCNANINN